MSFIPSMTLCSSRILNPLSSQVTNMSGRYLVQTNWDQWVPKTGADCEAQIAAFGPLETKACEDYIQAMYLPTLPPAGCAELCRRDSNRAPPSAGERPPSLTARLRRVAGAGCTLTAGTRRRTR